MTEFVNLAWCLETIDAEDYICSVNNLYKEKVILYQSVKQAPCRTRYFQQPWTRSRTVSVSTSHRATGHCPLLFVHMVCRPVGWSAVLTETPPSLLTPSRIPSFNHLVVQQTCQQDEEYSAPAHTGGKDTSILLTTGSIRPSLWFMQCVITVPNLIGLYWHVPTMASMNHKGSRTTSLTPTLSDVHGQAYLKLFLLS